MSDRARDDASTANNAARTDDDLDLDAAEN